MSTSSLTRPGLVQNLVRGAVGGIIAGAVFAVVTMWYAASTDAPARMPLLMISTIVKGDAALESGTASAPLGVLVHLVLSVAFGLTFAVLASRVSGNAAIALAGVVFGAALYVVNFLILAPVAFNVFQDANQPFELAIHLVFGSLLSLFFLRRQDTSKPEVERQRLAAHR